MMLWLALGYDCVLLVLVALDVVFLLPKNEEMFCRRMVSDALPLMRAAQVTLRFENHSDRKMIVRYRDLAPLSCKTEGNTGEIRLPAMSRLCPEYTIVPLGRGIQRWGPLTLRCRSGLGMLWRESRHEFDQEFKVHPDPKPRSREEAIAMRMSRQGPSGLRLALTRGEGREFESLREYRPDDEFPDP